MVRDLGRRVFFTANALFEDRFMLRAFAMAAAQLGAKMRPVNCFVHSRRVEGEKIVEHASWYLEPRSEDRQYDVGQLWLWWNDAEWLAANPEHPLAKLHDFAADLLAAEKHESTCSPVNVLQRGERYALLSVDLPPDKKKPLLELFGLPS